MFLPRLFYSGNNVFTMLVLFRQQCVYETCLFRQLSCNGFNFFHCFKDDFFDGENNLWGSHFVLVFLR